MLQEYYIKIENILDIFKIHFHNPILAILFTLK
jgi:hypothetical protein